MNEFDIKAAEWDENPMHWDRSRAIAENIIKLIPLKKEMTALEYGAGTGITSFLLKDYLKMITLMDNSTEMVKVINDKIITTKTQNLKALHFDLEVKDYDKEHFDLILTQMALHHVFDIETIITRFRNLLSPGGHLVIADLYKEDGAFHGTTFTGHKGFDPERLGERLRKNGFANTSFQKCFTINKQITDSESREFDMFLMTAVRN